ncbi:hypothetical protein LCGC14_2406390, partial [marine sediment metagenome]
MHGSREIDAVDYTARNVCCPKRGCARLCN